MSPPRGEGPLQALLERLRAQWQPTLPAFDPAPERLPEAQDLALTALMQSMLLWESPALVALGAWQRLTASIVDANELRVFPVEDLAGVLGRQSPRARERAQRLRSALSSIYDREHAVSLSRLAGASKRDARAYFEGLAGVPRYAASRATLLVSGAHAAPVDGRLLSRLIAEGLQPADATEDSCAAWLEREVRAGDLLEAHALLQRWVDEPSAEEGPVVGGATGAEPGPSRDEPAP